MPGVKDYKALSDKRGNALLNIRDLIERYCNDKPPPSELFTIEAITYVLKKYGYQFKVRTDGANSLRNAASEKVINKKQLSLVNADQF